MFKLVVLFSVLALAAGSPSALFPYAYGAHLAAPLAYAAPAPLYSAYNYRGPLSLAPGQPANVLAADGRPLDTLEVNADRAAHYTARAFDGHGLHLLKKRSIALAAPLAVSHTSRIDLPARYVGVAHAPLAYHGYAAPFAHGYAAPLAHGYAAPLAHGYAAPLAHAYSAPYW